MQKIELWNDEIIRLLEKGDTAFLENKEFILLEDHYLLVDTNKEWHGYKAGDTLLYIKDFHTIQQGICRIKQYFDVLGIAKTVAEEKEVLILKNVSEYKDELYCKFFPSGLNKIDDTDEIKIKKSRKWAEEERKQYLKESLVVLSSDGRKKRMRCLESINKEIEISSNWIKKNNIFVDQYFSSSCSPLLDDKISISLKEHYADPLTYGGRVYYQHFVVEIRIDGEWHRVYKTDEVSREYYERYTDLSIIERLPNNKCRFGVLSEAGDYLTIYEYYDGWIRFYASVRLSYLKDIIKETEGLKKLLTKDLNFKEYMKSIMKMALLDEIDTPTHSMVLRKGYLHIFDKNNMQKGCLEVTGEKIELRDETCVVVGEKTIFL